MAGVRLSPAVGGLTAEACLARLTPPPPPACFPVPQLKRLGDASAIVKGWTVYRDLDVSIKDMATTLPLVNELHSPSMRQRHWKSLATVCGVKALDPSDPKFCMEVRDRRQETRGQRRGRGGP